MSRLNILSEAWTDDSMQFGGLDVQRPSTHRINALMRRGNAWISDDPREQTDIEAGVEWLFVLSRSQKEMTQLFRVPLEEWEEIIDTFMGETPDAAIDEFTEYFRGIVEGIKAGAVEDAEPGKQQEELTHAS